MRSRVLRRCLQTSLLPLLFVSGPALEALAQTSPAVTLRYTTGAPAKTPWVMQLERFVENVNEESKSTIKIDPFIAAQLGNEQDTIQQIARGRIDMGGFSTGAVALVLPELAVLSIPFLFKSNAEQDCIIDKLCYRADIRGADQEGCQVPGLDRGRNRDVIGKRPFVSPNDVNGLKAASASNKVSAAMWSALGANPNPIGITEISSAFQTGLVDVQGSVITFYMLSGLNKVAPVLTRTEISDAPGIIVMNQAAWEKLSADQKSALERAVARRPADQLRKEIRDFEAALRGLHVKGGGQIVEVTREQREEWRSKLQPVWPTMIKEIGPEGDALFKAIEAGRAVCGVSRSGRPALKLRFAHFSSSHDGLGRSKSYPSHRFALTNVRNRTRDSRRQRRMGSLSRRPTGTSWSVGSLSRPSPSSPSFCCWTLSAANCLGRSSAYLG